MAEIRVEKKTRGIPWWLWVLGALGIVALIVGLSRRQGDEHAAAAPERAAPETPPPAPVTVTNARTCAADDGCAPNEACESGACKTLDASLCSTASVKFATDSAAIDPAQKAQIDRLARCLRADQAMKLDVAGSTDPRGTAPHNQTLGALRAHAVARELEARGVSPAQMHVVSFGEHQLLCADRDEACWAQNRRTDVKTTH